MNKYISCKDASIKWNISERSVRNYAKLGRIFNAFIKDGVWYVPSDAIKPKRINEKKNKNYLLEQLRREKKLKIKGGIYHKLQINLTYNSNYIEGNKLTSDQTRYIFEAKSIGLDNESNINVDDIIETVNHFALIDKIIDCANYELTEPFIKELHRILKSNTLSVLQGYFNAGSYKKRPNIVGDIETTSPKQVSYEMKNLLNKYNSKESHTLNEIIDFHVKFERIHPFDDGNGRIGRLIAFKECLKNNIVPFIILDDKKMFYYRGLDKYDEEKGYLIDTCLDGQEIIKTYLDYFKIPY